MVDTALACIGTRPGRTTLVTEAMKVLVIDDDEMLRGAVAKMLRRDGHAVIAAGDGASGMELFRKEQPWLVITDILMPGREGIETILELRRVNPRVKIIAMSGGGLLGEIHVLKMARLLGADDVIEKPFRTQELRDRVQALVPALQD
jgi:DNA-binding response OmpR family regulator